jgi:hypothetical protein
MVNLRQLFGKHGISFADRGKNVSRGNLSLHCPWCGSSDRSNHLAISELSGEYYCYRNPKHAGSNLPYLFKALGIPASEYAHLKFENVERIWKPDGRDYSAFQYFAPAEESDEALDYLRSRLFSNPKDVCKQFNLKVSKEGEWAGRLIIPMTVGWTGRSMRPHITLRYKAFTSQDGFFFHNQRASSVIICEGALDCIRISSITNQFDTIAKGRMALSPAILNYLRESNYLSIWNAPDGTVPYSQHHQETSMLKSYCTRADVNWLKLPEGRKDFGETSETETRKLLSTVGSVWQ